MRTKDENLNIVFNSPSDIVDAAKKYKIHKIELRIERYKSLQALCIYVGKLEKNPKKWKEFCEDPILGDYKLRPTERGGSKRALEIGLALMCGKFGSKTASLYARALRKLLSEGVPSTSIAEELKRRGGVKKIASPAHNGNGNGSVSRSTMSNTEKISSTTNVVPELINNCVSILLDGSKKRLDRIEAAAIDDEFVLRVVVVGKGKWKINKVYKYKPRV